MRIWLRQLLAVSRDVEIGLLDCRVEQGPAEGRNRAQVVRSFVEIAGGWSSAHMKVVLDPQLRCRYVAHVLMSRDGSHAVILVDRRRSFVIDGRALGADGGRTCWEVDWPLLDGLDVAA